MTIFSKVIKVFQNEGIAGVWKRVLARINRSEPEVQQLFSEANFVSQEAPKMPEEIHTQVDTEIQAPPPTLTSIDDEKNKVYAEYLKDLKNFNAFIEGNKEPGIENYYWYHTVDLGNGIVTPGDYDYRKDLDAFQFPKDMTGLKVLDVGAATGFFTFEFEKRGAEVTAVELPSLYEWDVIHDEKEKALAKICKHHANSSIEETYRRHLYAPFDFCHTQLKSSSKRVFSSIYNLTPELLGNQQFDIVFLGDILLHLFAPMRALNVIAPLCKSRLIIASDIFEDKSGMPLMYFLGTLNQKLDQRTWWAFSQQCMEEMMMRVGFKNVSVVGQYTGIARRDKFHYKRLVFHGTKE